MFCKQGPQSSDSTLCEATEVSDVPLSVGCRVHALKLTAAPPSLIDFQLSLGRTMFMFRAVIMALHYVVLGGAVELPAGYSRGVPAIWHNPDFIPTSKANVSIHGAQLRSKLASRQDCPAGFFLCDSGACCQSGGACCGGDSCCPYGCVAPMTRTWKHIC